MEQSVWNRIAWLRVHGIGCMERIESTRGNVTGGEAVSAVAHDFASGELGHTRRDGRKVWALETRQQSQHLRRRLHLRGRHHALAQWAREADGHVRHGLYAARQERVHLSRRRCNTREQLTRSDTASDSTRIV
jgi:hypothetical protein